jgi:SOS-response transcriptional repressor LexA
MSGLTPKQRKVLEFIRTFILAKGFSPSQEETAIGVGLRSKGAAHRHIEALARRGVITFRKGESRSIAIVRGLHVITIDLPTELDARVRSLAELAGVSPEAIVIECVRDSLSALRSQKISRETPRERIAM